MVLARFEHENAFRSKDVLLEYEVGYLGQFLEGVGGIGEDEVELLAARLDESEYIATDRGAYIGAKFLKAL